VAIADHHRAKNRDCVVLPIAADAFIFSVNAAFVVRLTLLCLMVVADFLVYAALIFAHHSAALQFLTGASGLFTAFVFLVTLIGVPMTFSGSASPPAQAVEPDTDDNSVMAALAAQKQHYTDSDLTLARAARRLSLPARDVSGTINRATGEKLARYVNGFRILHAQQALRETDAPVTQLMSEASFVSKSSFNTEFRRITGQTRSSYRAVGTDGQQPCPPGAPELLRGAVSSAVAGRICGPSAATTALSCNAGVNNVAASKIAVERTKLDGNFMRFGAWLGLKTCSKFGATPVT
jgi:AraC-like DNA-binding protein